MGGAEGFSAGACVGDEGTFMVGDEEDVEVIVGTYDLVVHSFTPFSPVSFGAPVDSGQKERRWVGICTVCTGLIYT